MISIIFLRTFSKVFRKENNLIRFSLFGAHPYAGCANWLFFSSTNTSSESLLFCTLKACDRLRFLYPLLFLASGILAAFLYVHPIARTALSTVDLEICTANYNCNFWRTPFRVRVLSLSEWWYQRPLRGLTQDNFWISSCNISLYVP